MVKIKKTDRGFSVYGNPRKDTYGTGYGVIKSSAAMYPAVWINLEPTKNGPKSALHLNRKQAKDLVARIQAFLKETEK